MSKNINKILIANRGEIACRVIRTCKKLGIQTVAVYSESDADSLHVKLADESTCIGAPEASKSYLNIEKIISAAKMFKADAIHPGYGFLSENAKFSEACEKNNIIFIGPSPYSISAMGDKKSAKVMLINKEPSIPVIPGYNGDDQTDETLIREAKKIGFPVLIKAAMGGGGKGMRVVWKAEELSNALDSARTEAKNSFGDDKLLIEKYFESVRHVEIQIMGDLYGNVTHVFERECSIQRRHQKIIEESPSVVMTPELREKMTSAAEKIGRLIKYSGAGTVEFIVDPKLNFYFLEVNTRLQVEHPVTESITGFDLVEAQIQVARGHTLQETGLLNKKINGHAVEVRLYAEDPENNFLPSPGPIFLWKQSNDDVRYDTGIVSGSQISVYYDPLIAKIITWAPTRKIAVQKMIHALQNTVVHGQLQTNKQFLIQTLGHKEFMNGNFDTQFLEKYSIKAPAVEAEQLDKLAVVALLWDWNQRNKARTVLKHVPSGFRNSVYKYQTATFVLKRNPSQKFVFEYNYIIDKQNSKSRKFEIKINGKTFTASILADTEDTLEAEIENMRRKYVCYQKDTDIYLSSPSLGDFCFVKKSKLELAFAADAEANDNSYLAPMTGKILKLYVKDGETVTKGQTIMTLESMKMELKQIAKTDGVVKLNVKEGAIVSPDTVLCIVTPPKK